MRSILDEPGSDAFEATRVATVLTPERSQAEVLIHDLPVGFEEAAPLYAEWALEAGMILGGGLAQCDSSLDRRHSARRSSPATRARESGFSIVYRCRSGRVRSRQLATDLLSESRMAWLSPHSAAIALTGLGTRSSLHRARRCVSAAPCPRHQAFSAGWLGLPGIPRDQLGIAPR